MYVKLPFLSSQEGRVLKDNNDLLSLSYGVFLKIVIKKGTFRLVKKNISPKYVKLSLLCKFSFLSESVIQNVLSSAGYCSKISPRQANSSFIYLPTVSKI